MQQLPVSFLSAYSWEICLNLSLIFAFMSHNPALKILSKQLSTAVNQTSIVLH